MTSDLFSLSFKTIRNATHEQQSYCLFEIRPKIWGSGTEYLILSRFACFYLTSNSGLANGRLPDESKNLIPWSKHGSLSASRKSFSSTQ